MGVEDFLSKDQRAELENLHRKCKQKRYADRIKSVLLLNAGFSATDISKILLMDDQSVWRYLETYETEGVNGLISDKYTGGLSFLSETELVELRAHLIKNTYLKASQVCEYVKQQYNCIYSVRGITDLLKRLGFSYKKPKMVPGKGNPEEQQKFVEKYYKLRANLNINDTVWFADGCHPMLNPIAGYGWILKGTDKEIPSNTGRERLNLNGAYNPVTKEVEIMETETINAQSTILLLQIILSKNPKGLIYFITDNAKYYRCILLQEFLKRNKRIILIALPSYSPNLNLIERLWRFYKKEVLYQKYYPTKSDFKNATMHFFNNISNFTDELSTLMTEKFRILRPIISQT